MKVAAVTSMGPEQWRCYGSRFVDSFIRHWQGGVDLHLWHEDGVPTPNWLRVQMHPHALDFEWHSFQVLHREKDKAASEYYNRPCKWSHKVFAMTNRANWADDPDWMVWLDGDVETIAEIDDDFYRQVLPDSADLVYLGRQDHKHSELGFIAFRMTSPAVRGMLAAWRRYYTGGDLFKLEWPNDAFSFDAALRDSAIPVERRLDLSAGIAGTHVWPKTALARWMDHRKGGKRKRQAYGRTA